MASDTPIPIRKEPRTPDGDDNARVKLVTDRWDSQNDLYEPIERTIEEHLRMISGHQWDVWSPVTRSFVDPLRYLSAEERRWRQRPVMDFLGYWYMVTLSKVTENQPLVGFLPANGDEASANLAEVLDPVFKTLWDETEMNDRLVQAAAWCLIAGESYLISSAAEMPGATSRPLTGPAVLPYQPEGEEEARDVVIEDAMFGENGMPVVELGVGEMGEPVPSMMEGAEPATATQGTVRVGVASPLEIRSAWGQHTPWTERQWIIHRWFDLPSAIEQRYNVKVEPTATLKGDSAPGTLERMLFGSGYFGAARGADPMGGSDEKVKGQFVCGYTLWEKPCPDYPEGRLLVIGGETVLHDSVRPFDTEAAGPIRRLQFMPIPGRPIGSTPLEKMVPLQRRYNRIEAQIAEHTNLCTNPVLLLHDAAGVDPESFVARPGVILTHSAGSGIKPGEWLSPPALGIDVWKHKGDVRDHLFTIGSITGNESANPAADASGELIQQLRYNADRPLAPMTKSIEWGAAGVAEDWLAILPVVMPFETVVHYAGEDNILKAVTVAPELWEGTVSARPMMESAAPESREKRQERVLTLYQLGAFGDLMDPVQKQEATKRLLELSRFPELTRAARPGGKHRMMAETNLAKLLRGVDPTSIPILPMYDLTVHLAVFNDLMSGPEYLNVPEDGQQRVAAFYTQLQDAQEAQQAAMLMRQMDTQMASQAMGLLPSGGAPNAPNSPPPQDAPGGTTQGIPNGNRNTEPALP